MSKLTDLPQGTPDDNDIIEYVDTDDTTLAPTGTNKGVLWSAVKAALSALYAPLSHTHTETDVTDLDKYTQAEVDASQATQDARLDALEGGGGSGEANTASNQGGGEGLALAKNGVDLPFKTLTAGAGIALNAGVDTLEIENTGGGALAASLSQVPGKILIDSQTDPVSGEFNFTGLSGYTKYIIEGYVQSSVAATFDYLFLLFNGDTANNNYYSTSETVNGGSSSALQTNSPQIQFVSAASSGATEYTRFYAEILNPTDGNAMIAQGTLGNNNSGTNIIQTDFTIHNNSITTELTQLTLKTDGGEDLVGTLSIWGERDIAIEDSETVTTRTEVPITLSGGVFSVDLTNYQDGDRLVLAGTVKSSGGSAGIDTLLATINGDTTAANYVFKNLYAQTTPAGGLADNDRRIGYVVGAGSPSDAYSYVELTLEGYTDPTTRKTIGITSGGMSGTAATIDVFGGGSHWKTAAAVTSVDIGASGGNLSGTLKAYIEKQGVIATTPAPESASPSQVPGKVLLDTQTASADAFLEFTVPSGYTNVWFEGELESNNASSQDELNMFLNDDLSDASYSGAIIMGSGSANGQSRAHPFCSFIQGSTGYSDPSPFEVKLQKYDRTAYHSWTSRYYVQRESGARYVGGGGCNTLTQFGPVTKVRLSPEYGSTITGEVRMYGERDITLEDSASILTKVEVPVTNNGTTLDVDLSAHQDGVQLIFEGELSSTISTVAGAGMRIRYNGDTNDANYDTIGGGHQTPNVGFSADRTDSRIAIIGDTVNRANSRSTVEIKINDYAGSNYKNARGFVSGINGSAAYNLSAEFQVEWSNTAPVTSIQFDMEDGASFVGNLRCYVVKTGVIATTPAASGGGGMTLIEEITADGTTITEFDFDSIPQTYNRVIIKGWVRSDGSGSVGNMYAYTNGDFTNANYHYQDSSGGDNVGLHNKGSLPYIAAIATNGATPAGAHSTVRIEVEEYTSTALTHQLASRYATLRDPTNQRSGDLFCIHKTATDAITRITLRGNATNLTGVMRLYGED